MKDLFHTEEKYQRYERLHSRETVSSARKKRDFPDLEKVKSATTVNPSNLTFRPKINSLQTTESPPK